MCCFVNAGTLLTDKNITKKKKRKSKEMTMAEERNEPVKTAETFRERGREGEEQRVRVWNEDPEQMTSFFFFF